MDNEMNFRSRDVEMEFEEEVRSGKSKKGFASMKPERQQQIASMGGKAAHLAGKGAHEWTSDEARAAGKKGGLARQRNLQNHNRDLPFTDEEEDELEDAA